MKGKILGFDDNNDNGVISGDDGNRYKFERNGWKGKNFPAAGVKVDFAVSGDSAEEIYPDGANLSGGASKKIVAALFAFFLGAFGAHKFYLGYTKQGVIMLLTFLLGFILLGIPSFIIGVVAFIEFIMYLVKSDEDFERTYVVGKRPWF